jgi:hypothetical protein
MKARVLGIASLVCLLLGGVFVLHSDHVCERDRAQIETIITGDARFKNISVKRSGTGLFLDGSVLSSEDLDFFFQKVNKVKRGRVVSRIVVQTRSRGN